MTIQLVLVGQLPDGSHVQLECPMDRETVINVGKAIADCGRSLACNTVVMHVTNTAVAIRPFPDKPKINGAGPDFRLTKDGLVNGK